MSDRDPFGIWTAEYLHDSMQILSAEIYGLRAMLLLELDEDGNHIPFVYPEDEWGSISYESLLSETLILDDRKYIVIKGMYHSDIVEEISSSIEVAPWEYSEFLLARPPNEGDYWADGRFYVDALCYRFEDEKGEILKTALDGNCFVATFADLRNSRGFEENRKRELHFNISRVVYLEDRWDIIPMEVSEGTVFSGSSYVEPKVLNAIRTVGVFVVENALGFGIVFILLFYLAVNRLLKRRKLCKGSINSELT